MVDVRKLVKSDAQQFHDFRLLGLKEAPENFGFKPCGVEEKVIKIDNTYYDEILMVKFLK